jgi:hypothetical protein
VYDDLQPRKSVSLSQEEPLLVLASPRSAAVGLAHGPHDLPEVSREIAVPRLDVEPPLFAQADGPAVRIERRPEHLSILRGAATDGNCPK